jgi:hypothetical protein
LGNFSTFFVDLVHFSGFGIMYQQKSGNPDMHGFCPVPQSSNRLQSASLAFSSSSIFSKLAPY